MASPHKGHPEYERGYFAALGNEPCSGGSVEFLAGYEAACEAVELLKKHGFARTGAASFSKTLNLSEQGK